MMEKFDGVRVYWTGHTLFTRDLKTKIDIPDIKMRSIPFEGELW
jgi:hypothetical protein